MLSRIFHFPIWNSAGQNKHLGMFYISILIRSMYLKALHICIYAFDNTLQFLTLDFAVHLNQNVKLIFGAQNSPIYHLFGAIYIICQPIWGGFRPPPPPIHTNTHTHIHSSHTRTISNCQHFLHCDTNNLTSWVKCNMNDPGCGTFANLTFQCSTFQIQQMHCFLI